MKNIGQLIAKLESLTWVEADDKVLKSQEGFELSYQIKFLTSPIHATEYPVQIVIQVRKEGVHVTTWGCEDNESNRAFVNFYEAARNDAWETSFHTKDKLQKGFRDEFYNLNH